MQITMPNILKSFLLMGPESKMHRIEATWLPNCWPKKILETRQMKLIAIFTHYYCLISSFRAFVHDSYFIISPIKYPLLFTSCNSLIVFLHDLITRQSVFLSCWMTC